ncbi:hypothetical protein BC2230_90122 [Burkholderia cepacia]
MTRCPRSASANATPRPNPDPAPVINTVLVMPPPARFTMMAPPGRTPRPDGDLADYVTAFPAANAPPEWGGGPHRRHGSEAAACRQSQQRPISASAL